MRMLVLLGHLQMTGCTVSVAVCTPSDLMHALRHLVSCTLLPCAESVLELTCFQNTFSTRHQCSVHELHERMHRSFGCDTAMHRVDTKIVHVTITCCQHCNSW